tara:strand:- start:5736 stop:6836 length:1101 start_codon:yes stop_codon:yes gene_type:complete
MAKTNVTFTNFAAKKLLGKTQVRPSLTDAEEAFPSNVSVPGGGVFAESIPREPGTDFFTLYSASAGAPATVERVYFDCVAISDGFYDADAADADGGDESQSAGDHAYYLKLPSNYQTTSSNPNKGSGNFINDKRIYLSRGGLQLVPPFTTDAGLPGSSGNNRYFVELYTGDPTNPANKISSTDAIDWQFDYYSGIIFIQDYQASKIPVTASAYLYVGKYLDEKLEGVGSTIVKDEGSNITTAVTSFDFVGAGVTATNSSNNVTVTIPGGINYSRTAVTTTITASTSARIMGVSASSAIEIRLPAASGYSAGQFFTIKDEAGNANTNNITVLTTGGETIDGSTSIILESPHAAVNIYSDGTSKFFVY